LNLAINARDAMPDRGKLLIETDNIELEEEKSGVLDVEPGSYVMLRVADTGDGIAPETLDHVFEPIFTTKDVGKFLPPRMSARVRAWGSAWFMVSPASPAAS
jgi:signal transduction histidine kinase